MKRFYTGSLALHNIEKIAFSTLPSGTLIMAITTDDDTTFELNLYGAEDLDLPMVDLLNQGLANNKGVEDEP